MVARIGPWLHRREAATSLRVYGEIVEYLKGRPDFAGRYRQLRGLVRQIYPYSLTYPILESYADIRRALRAPHGSGLIGDINTLIAATALERDLTVVTTDTDFQRVPGLKVLHVERDRL